ncbi:guided entry of tail-anchored proteins factor 1-like [Sphaerodactylus townsendi]|uniref:guided entry of tail-anchored proteins factor 1-like n=1 Tax=Sphaerodactylus townsendi TaxID=933632 RepID=UPI0020269309|nr:guided entry of tail-anchored proteins factor 1-like [Sphaerodactylus townsendi]
MNQPSEDEGLVEEEQEAINRRSEALEPIEEIIRSQSEEPSVEADTQEEYRDGATDNCNITIPKIPLLSCSSIISKLLQKDVEQESQVRSEIQNMKQEVATISMMDEFARYAGLERKINKMTDKLKTHVKTRTAKLAKIKWVINIVFYILQAALMISQIWKCYLEPVTVLPSKWLAPLVAFPTGVAGGVGITCWLVVCNKVVAIMLHPFS